MYFVATKLKVFAIIAINKAFFQLHCIKKIYATISTIVMPHCTYIKFQSVFNLITLIIGHVIAFIKKANT
jgi:hypothetical protein